jgi:hypothetical protein
LEGEDTTKKLLEALVTVRPASIPRWNEHKDVKEDKEREPCVFIPYDRSSGVDPELKNQESESESGNGGRWEKLSIELNSKPAVAAGFGGSASTVMALVKGFQKVTN